MEARLIIALDDKCQIYKTLKTSELQELDIYMIKNFENSDVIRNSNEYKDIINQFLEDHKNYRSKSQRQNNGYIRVVYTNEEGLFQPLKAYYKKDKAKLNRRQVVSDIKRNCKDNITLVKQMRKDANINKLMSGFTKRELDNAIRYKLTSRYDTAINEWIKNLSLNKDGYFYTRVLDRYIEKYLEQQRKEFEENCVIKASIGTICVPMPSQVKEEQEITRIPITKAEYYQNAKDDPEELYSLYSLDEINLIESIQKKKER